MRQYFAYIRVSTTRQGELGVSLPQQKDAIERYAQHNQLEICQWFEEQETAAKQGRPVFGAMIKQLRKSAAAGVIIHKIDRSARNLRDWTDLGELIDKGIEVHFANESLDLTSRGGRLSADIQAVVAADYIRNLREETKKGFYGRLKQGFYPMPAPVGYLDNGAAKAKTLDPHTAPAVRHAFELYATGRHNLRTVAGALVKIGLHRPDGTPLRKNHLAKILNNPFYCGAIRIKKTGEYYHGNHEPLISRRLFDRVRAVMSGKINTTTTRFDRLYRRRIQCKSCRYSLVGEGHKGHVYYRCQTRSCPTTCIREEAVDAEVLGLLARIRLSKTEQMYARQQLQQMRGEAEKHVAHSISALTLKFSQIEERLSRLTDALIDSLIDKETFEQRKKALLMERLQIEGDVRNLQRGDQNPVEATVKFLERADAAYSAYIHGSVDEKRDLLDAVTLNRIADGKRVIITPKLPFGLLADRRNCLDGAPSQGIHRVWKPLLDQLIQNFETQRTNG